jgi:hypothetical protein
VKEAIHNTLLNIDSRYTNFKNSVRSKNSEEDTGSKTQLKHDKVRKR